LAAGRERRGVPEGMDFLDCLGPDTSAIVFRLLCDPADLARASAVSRSWRRFGTRAQIPWICLHGIHLQYLV
jgi:hypothetical protein